MSSTNNDLISAEQPSHNQEPSPVESIANSQEAQDFHKATSDAEPVPKGLRERFSDAVQNLFTVKVEVSNPKIEKEAEEAKNILSKVGSSFDKMLKQLNSLLTNSTSKSNSQVVMEKIEFVISVLVSFVAMYQAPTWELKSYIAIAFITANKLTSQLVYGDILSVFFKKTKDEEMHSQAKGEEISENMFTMFVKLLGHSFGFGDINPKLDEKRAKKLGALGSAVKGVENIVILVYKAFKYAYRWLYEWFYEVPFEAKDQTIVLQKMQSVIEVYHEIEANDSKYWLEENRHVKLVKAENDCDDIDATINIKGFKEGRATPYFVAERSVRRLMSELRAVWRNSNARVRPVWIHLEGPPNMGKTNLAHLLAASLCEILTGKPLDTKTDVFHYKPNENFEWEGYMNNFFVFWDDVLQDISNSENMTGQCVNLIYMVNDAPYQLVMSKAEDKGKFWFTSKVIITTGNQPHWNDAKMADRNALLRRMDARVRVSLKDGIVLSSTTKPTADVYKLELSPDKWYLQKGTVVSEKIEIPDLLKKISSLYRERNTKKSSMTDFITDYAKQFRKFYEGPLEKDENNNHLELRSQMQRDDPEDDEIKFPSQPREPTEENIDYFEIDTQKKFYHLESLTDEQFEKWKFARKIMNINGLDHEMTNEERLDITYLYHLRQFFTLGNLPKRRIEFPQDSAEVFPFDDVIKRMENHIPTTIPAKHKNELIGFSNRDSFRRVSAKRIFHMHKNGMSICPTCYWAFDRLTPLDSQSWIKTYWDKKIGICLDCASKLYRLHNVYNFKNLLIHSFYSFQENKVVMIQNTLRPTAQEELNVLTILTTIPPASYCGYDKYYSLIVQHYYPDVKFQDLFLHVDNCDPNKCTCVDVKWINDTYDYQLRPIEDEKTTESESDTIHTQGFWSWLSPIVPPPPHPAKTWRKRHPTHDNKSFDLECISCRGCLYDMTDDDLYDPELLSMIEIHGKSSDVELENKDFLKNFRQIGKTIYTLPIKVKVRQQVSIGLKALCVALAAVGTVVCSFKIYKALTDKPKTVKEALEDPIVAQVKHDNDPVIQKLEKQLAELQAQTLYAKQELLGKQKAAQTQRDRPLVRPGSLLVKHPTLYAHSAALAPLEDISTKVLQNVLKIQASFSRGGSYSQKIMMLKDTFGWVPRHFAEICEQPDFEEFVITDKDGVFKFKIGTFEMVYEDGFDSAFILFDQKQFGNKRYKDITKFYLRKTDDLREIQTSPFAFGRRRESGASLVVANSVKDFGTGTYQHVGPDKQKTSVTSQGLLYVEGDALDPQDGDCSSPYFTASTKFDERKVVGQHVAGAKQRSYCLLLTQESIEKAYDNLKPMHSQTRLNLPEGLSDNVREVPKERQINLPYKSNLRPTLFVDDPIAAPIRAPAVLSPVNGVSPMYEALKKNISSPLKLTDAEVARFKITYAYVINRMYGTMNPHVPITVNQALNRPPCTDHITPVYMNTASGVGENWWTSNPVTKGKKKLPFVDMQPNGYRTAKPLLDEALKKMIQKLLLNPETYELICQDALKDELRPIEKVKAVKTRIFVPLPVEMLVLMRMLFYDLVEHQIHHKSAVWSAVGINPHSVEWKMLYEYLVGDSESEVANVIPGDVSGLDRSTKKIYCDNYRDNITRLYEQKDQGPSIEVLPGLYLSAAERNKLRFEVLHKVFGDRWHVVAGWMYHCTEWNPSGNFLTTMFNITNMAVTTFESAQDYAEKILKTFMSLIEIDQSLNMVFFGDDNLIVPKGKLKTFGMGAMVKGFARLGLKYTDFKKGAVVWEDEDRMIAVPQHYKITDVEFLHRFFLVRDSCVYAPIDKSLIIDMTNWCTTSHSVKIGTYKSCFAALCEAYHWGPVFFYWLKDQINAKFYDLALPPISVFYEDFYARFHGMQIDQKMNLPFNLEADEYLDIWFDFDHKKSDPMMHSQMKRIDHRTDTEITADKEAEARSKEGTVSKIFGATEKILGYAKNIPILNEVAVWAHPIMMLAHTVSRKLGWDYPRNLAVTQRYINDTTANWAPGRGLNSAHLIAFDPENHVSNDPSFFDEIGGPLCSFQTYKTLPCLVSTFDFDGSNTPGEIIATIPVSPIYMPEAVFADTFTQGPLSAYASMFRYWRGSIQYGLMVSCSSFKSTRIRVEFHPDPTLISFVTASSVGDIISCTMDIQGDSWFPFQIPFMKDTPWLPVGLPHNLKASNVVNWAQVCNGCFVVRVLNPPVVAISSADTTINVALWMAGGADFVVSEPWSTPEHYSWTPDPDFVSEASKHIKTIKRETDANNNNSVAVSAPSEQTADDVTILRKLLKSRMKSQMMRDLFSKTFKPLAPADNHIEYNIVQGEYILSWPELMHRYMFVDTATVATTFHAQFKLNPWDPQFFSTFSYSFWPRFLYAFFLHRGNFRINTIHDAPLGANSDVDSFVSKYIPDGLGSLDNDPNIDTTTKGMVYQDLNVRNTQEVEIPYSGIFPFHSLQYLIERYEKPGVVTDLFARGANVSFVLHSYLATGDNWSCGRPAPPGYLVYDAPMKSQMQSESHGHEDRKGIETTVQETQALSSFRDTVGVTDNRNAAVTTKVHNGMDPYNEPIIEQMKRLYIVKEVDWLSTGTIGSVVTELNFPKDLLNVDKISELVNRYKYLSAGIEVEVRLNSTKFNEGRLLIVYETHWNPLNLKGQATNVDMYSASCLPQMIMSAASSETVRFQIPFVAPSNSWDLALDHDDAAYTGFFGFVRFYVLAPLRQIGAASAALQVTCYARFVEPKLFGNVPKGTSLLDQVRRPVNGKFKVSSKD